MFKKLGTVMLATVGLFCSLSVHASTYNLGTLVAGDNEFGAYTVGVSNFSDRLDFDISAPANLSGGVGSIKVTVGSIVKRDIDHLSLSIFDSSNHLLPLASGSNADNLSVAFPLAGGHYYAMVTGEGTGTLGGKYGGVFTISPTPEPETWAMMGIGLGFLNFVGRRRKAKNS